MKRASIQILGDIVKRERKKRGITQSELGAFAGTGINFVYGLENGKTGLRISKVLDVLKVLGLQLNIVYGKGEIVNEIK